VTSLKAVSLQLRQHSKQSRNTASACLPCNKVEKRQQGITVGSCWRVESWWGLAFRYKESKCGMATCVANEEIPNIPHIQQAAAAAVAQQQSSQLSTRLRSAALSISTYLSIRFLTLTKKLNKEILLLQRCQRASVATNRRDFGSHG